MALVIAILIAWTNVASAWHLHQGASNDDQQKMHLSALDIKTQHSSHTTDHCCHASAHMIALPRFSPAPFDRRAVHWQAADAISLISLSSAPDTPPPIR